MHAKETRASAAHYCMGGIAITPEAEVLRETDHGKVPVPGLPNASPFHSDLGGLLPLVAVGSASCS